MKRGLKWLLISVLTACFGLSIGVYASTLAVKAEETVFDKTINTKITDINNERLDNGNTFVMVLSATDYMTAEGWNNHNYMWLNDENVATENRGNIDLSKNNVCNARMDKNLDKYNFEDYIFIDGVSLAEYSKTHAYRLFGNKRTRVDTLSIDFDPGVLSTISKIEIREGCQLPTLAYAYIGGTESSCLLVEETVTYGRANDKWSDFLGYEENVEYQGDVKMFELYLQSAYKGHETVMIDAYTDFFTRYAVQGEYLKGSVAVTRANTAKGNLMVLNFVHPISADQFNTLNLRVYINHQVDVVTYNADEITSSDLGPALETFTVGGGQYSYLTLNTALYVGANNQIKTIVFQFVEDCAIQYDKDGNELKDGNGDYIRDTFHFVSFNLSNETAGDLVSNDSLILFETDDAYELTFRFNKRGGWDENCGLDTTKVTLNGTSLSQIISNCAEATAEWYSAKGIYQINFRLPKAYTGAGSVKNAEYSFADNHMSVEAGLIFPNGDVLDTTYTCHVYANEQIVDSEMASEYRTTQVEDVKFSYVQGSQNIHFTLYFDHNVTSVPYYHACETEHWRSTELKTVNESAYDSATAKIFVDGGYKSSLLNNIVINGLTIGELHARESWSPTNVQIHYGNTALNCVDIFIENGSRTYLEFYELVEDGNGITIEVKSGLKFMNNHQTKATQTFVFANGNFSEEITETPIIVYYNGLEVKNGDSVTVDVVVSQKSIAVEGVEKYEITSAKNGNVTEYTILYGNGEKFTFKVVEEIAVEEPQGCASVVGSSIAMATILSAAAVLFMKKKEAK